jgi:hypothetical protein
MAMTSMIGSTLNYNRSPASISSRIERSSRSRHFSRRVARFFYADQIIVSVEPRRLTVSGEREIDVTCGGNAPAHTEKRTQRISRVEELPMDVDPSRVAAKLDGEALEIVMPKLADTNKPSEKAGGASSKG